MLALDRSGRLRPAVSHAHLYQGKRRTGERGWGRSSRREGVSQVRTLRGNTVQPRTSAGQHERGVQSRKPSSKARLMLGL